MCKPVEVADSDVALELTVSQARVLGALLEKELATPDVYPMTLNALAAACSQTSNRDPVIRFEPSQVETAALALKSKGLLRVVYPGAGERSTRYRQVVDEALVLEAADRALLSLLLLRGPQTAAELRARVDRLYAFSDAGAVEAVLGRLAARPLPLVIRLDRLPGQKEARWAQLLEAAGPTRVFSSGHDAPHREAGRVDDAGAGAGTLERRVAALEAQVEALIEALGDLVPPGLASGSDDS